MSSLVYICSSKQPHLQLDILISELSLVLSALNMIEPSLHILKPGYITKLRQTFAIGVHIYVTYLFCQGGRA